MDRGDLAIRTEPRARVLIGGGIGEGRGRLVAGRPVELVPVDGLRDAEALLDDALALAIVRHRLDGGTALDLIANTATAPGRPPIIVVLDESEWGLVDEYVGAGASHLVSLSDVDQLVYLTERVLGLGFSRGARVDIRCPCETYIEASWVETPTVDLRATGVAVEDLPESVAVGTVLRLRLTVMDYTMDLWGKVARRWKRAGRSLAGVQLMALGQQQRIYIEAAIATLRADEARETDPPAMSSAVPEDNWSQWARGQLQRLMNGEGERTDYPAWMPTLLPELTPIERSALLGVSVPEWVDAALRIRVGLAHYRDDCPMGPPPAAITEACQKFFDAIASETEDRQAFDVAEQIAAIKGRFIQEFMGAQADPIAELALAMPEPVAANEESGWTDARQTGEKRSAVLLGPPPWAMQARRVLKLMVVTAASTLVIAVTTIAITNDRETIETVELTADDVGAVGLDRLEIVDGVGVAVVGGVWLVGSRTDRAEGLKRLADRLHQWEYQVRLVALHDETGAPIGIYDLEMETWVEFVTGPMPQAEGERVEEAAGP